MHANQFICCKAEFISVLQHPLKEKSSEALRKTVGLSQPSNRGKFSKGERKMQ
jgi:hypothetical protein